MEPRARGRRASGARLATLHVCTASAPRCWGTTRHWTEAVGLTVVAAAKRAPFRPGVHSSPSPGHPEGGQCTRAYAQCQISGPRFVDGDADGARSGEPKKTKFALGRDMQHENARVCRSSDQPVERRGTVGMVERSLCGTGGRWRWRWRWASAMRWHGEMGDN